MSNRIPKKEYLEGLTLCEKNGLEFYLATRERLELREWKTAYLFAVISFEELVKAHMIMDSYNDDYISGNKWKNKMTQHKPKLMYGAIMLDQELKKSALRFIDKGGLPENIKTDINTNYTKKFVDDVLKNRLSYVYVDYDHNNKNWVPVKDTYMIDDILEILNASASLWVLLSRRKNDHNIKTLPDDQYQVYLK